MVKPNVDPNDPLFKLPEVQPPVKDENALYLKLASTPVLFPTPDKRVPGDLTVPKPCGCKIVTPA